MTFDINRRQPVIEPFEAVIIETDIIGPTCTIGESEGWYTPLTCDQDTVTGKMTHIFSTPNAAYQIRTVLGSDAIYPQLSRISEVPARIKPSNGLAGRGKLTFNLKDFEGDSGPVRTTENGDYIAKLRRRNILENKPVRLILGHVIDGQLQMDDLQVRHFVIDSFQYRGDREWTVSCKDELYLLDKEEAVFPPQGNGKLRADINETVTSIPVDAETDYSNAEVVRIGDELLNVLSVQNNMTSTATLTVSSRGSSIQGFGGRILSRTIADDHDADDEVFICDLVSNERLDDLLSRILISAGVDAARIPSTAWQTEVDEWHASTRVNTLFIESKEANEVIGRILRDYLMDIWFNPVSRLIELSAISVWRETDMTVRDGYEIEAYSLGWRTRPTQQFTRSSILFDKKNFTEDNEVSNFRRLSRNVDAIAEQDYGVRLKQLEPSTLLDRDGADLLTQRFTARFSSPPVSYDWITREQFLNFNTGDVVNIDSPDLIGFNGLPQIARAQVTSVQPVYNNRNGRFYRIKAEAYEPPIGGGGQVGPIVITGRNLNLNLHILAGAPPNSVDLTFVLDGAVVGSNSIRDENAAIRAGNFAEGSTLRIILINGAKWSSLGGRGGNGGTSNSEGPDQFFSPPDSGGIGGLCYDAMGIDTDIYLSGTIDTYTANGELRAPAGGGAGGVPAGSGNSAGGGGGGGAGIEGGRGGISDLIDGTPSATANGNQGGEDGVGGDGGDTSNGGGTGRKGGNWGLKGEDITYLGQLIRGGNAGKALEKNGAVVNIFGSANFTQGNGDAPDDLQP